MDMTPTLNTDILDEMNQCKGYLWWQFSPEGFCQSHYTRHPEIHLALKSFSIPQSEQLNGSLRQIASGGYRLLAFLCLQPTNICGTNLTGGIDAYSQLVDPSIRRYRPEG